MDTIMEEKELPAEIESSIIWICDKYQDCIEEIIRTTVMRCLLHDPDRTAMFFTKFSSKLMQTTLKIKNKEINDRYLGQEFTLMGLDQMFSSGKGNRSKMDRMFMTVMNVSAFLGDGKFDERFYCKAENKSALKISRLVREVYEFIRDGGNIDSLCGNKPVRKRFIEKMMEFYKEREK